LSRKHLVVRGAREHNLKNVSVEIPRERLVVVTGLSGSGKSSLAFDTIYAEGQRRYIESLSAYARQFLGVMEKPDVDMIDGLSPAISIEQKSVSRNPRSTVGTVTEIYDYLRLLYARAGTPYCPDCGLPIMRQPATQIVVRLMEMEEGTAIQVVAPLVRGRKGEFRELFDRARRDGFVRALVDGRVYDLNEIPRLARYENHDVGIVVDRLVVREQDRSRLSDSVETALRAADGVVQILERRGREDVSHLFSEHYACADCGTSFPELEPRVFSFNSPHGACTGCGGLGTTKEVEGSLLVASPSLSILEGAVIPWGDPGGHLRRSVIPGLAQAYEFDPNTPWRDLSRTVRDALLHGSGPLKIRFPYKTGKMSGHYDDHWEGIVANMERRYRETTSEHVREQLEKFMSSQPCRACGGSRLGPFARGVRVGGRSIGELADLPVQEALDFVWSIAVTGEPLSRNVAPAPGDPLPGAVAGPILKEVRERLGFLRNVGLGYLSLSRSADTLSGGESQRIRLSTQIGSGLMGMLYVLDEPSIGLHPKDNVKMIETLRKLRDIGNTVIVVEHDESTIRAADHIIELGPGPGIHGGHVVVQGELETILNSDESLTGLYMSGKRRILMPAQRRPLNGAFLSLSRIHI